ncbi:GMC family oxidoreductase [Devosia sp. 2618]|uniref:GMC family oxidoreductase n=1 Tax=Devosia sp. 2618 TaxID=3156454 RepID=UPI003395FA51
MSSHYDAIIVGAGASGNIVAAVLAEAGRRVLLVERGPMADYATSGHRDHLRNQRFSPYGHNAGPDVVGNPRVLVTPDGREQILAPHQPGYHNNAAVVGGGTLVYGGLAWRFLPDDFRMATRYGVPEGSSLVDWPISYEDLAPYYQRAEWEVGVSGDAAGPVQQPARADRYPMPPMPSNPGSARLRQGAAALGLNVFAPPLLVNSVPRDGRAACIECGSCVGFPCPSDGKNGTQNTMLPRALVTGNCELVTGAVVEQIDCDARGNIVGISYLVDDTTGPERHVATADQVILCAGAIETARLLLNSKSRHHPQGIGNDHGQVGLSLQGHYYPTAFGLFDDIVSDGRGRA